MLAVGFPGSSVGKEYACNVGDLVSISGWGRSLEKGKATHSSILAWRIQGQSMGSQRVGHARVTFAHLLMLARQSMTLKAGDSVV